MPGKHKVWIEIEHGMPEEMKERAALLTNMVHRLGGDPNAKFWYNSTRAELNYGTPSGFRQLADRGEWFNLDYFGREETEGEADAA